MSIQLKIVYFSLALFYAAMVISFFFVSALYIVIFIVWYIICGISAILYSVFLPSYKNADISKQDTLLHNLKRIALNIIVIAALNYAFSATPLPLVISTVIRAAIPTAEQYFMNMAMDILFLAILIFITFKLNVQHGFSDTSQRRFNPHLCVVSAVLPFIVIFPQTMMHSLLESTYPQALMKYFAFNLIMFLLGTVLLSLLQICLIILAYCCGRSNFFKRHPHDTDYGKKEADEFVLSYASEKIR